nr:hypothetical protein OsI_17348 [Ipomoea batatas]
MWNFKPFALKANSCHNLHGFKLPQGCCNVASSHKITPKLYKSDFSLDGSSRRTSGAIHSGFPAADFDERNVFAFKRERPKSHTFTVYFLSTKRFGDFKSR